MSCNPEELKVDKKVHVSQDCDVAQQLHANHSLTLDSMSICAVTRTGQPTCREQVIESTPETISECHSEPG